MLVRLFETLTHFLRLANADKAGCMVENVGNTLREGFSDVRFKEMTRGQKSFYIPVFTALLRLVRESRSRSMLPLVRKYLLTGTEDDFKDSIRDTLNEYVLQMTEEEALETALCIVRASQQQRSLNPNVLREERHVVDHVCGRILHRLEPDALITFLGECLPLLLGVLKMGGKGGSGPNAEECFLGDIAQMNQLVCMLIVLDAIYTVTPWPDIEAKVHTKVSKDEIMGQKHLTMYFINRLQATRKLRLPSEKREDKDAREIFTVLVQYAMRDYASIISHTQSGPNLSKTIFNMKSTEWLNIVGAEPPTFSTEAGNVY